MARRPGACGYQTALRRAVGYRPRRPLPTAAGSHASASRTVAAATIHLLAGRPLAARNALNALTCTPPTDTLERLVVPVLDVIATELCGHDIDSPARLKDVIRGNKTQLNE